jgi:prepilin-type N-terminal cleavage/methylation domain-containing protein
MIAAPIRRGLSLVELLVAMAISSIVLGGAVAAIGMSGRTFRAATSGLAASPALDGLARLSADVELAMAFTERTSTAVSFYVPDRTGDGAPELLRYAWAGSDGDPLTLSMNGSPAAAIVPSIRGVSLEYLVASVPAQPEWYAPPPPAPTDIQVFSRDYTGGTTAHALGMTSSLSAIVQPALDAGYSGFRVTRVRIPMQRVALGGDVTVALHRVNMTTAVPEPSAIAATTVPGDTIPSSMAEVEVILDNSVRFAGGSHVAIVVSQNLGTSACRVPLEASPSYLTDGWVAATNLLGQWQLNATKDVPLKIYAELFKDG